MTRDGDLRRYLAPRCEAYRLRDRRAYKCQFAALAEIKLDGKLMLVCGTHLYALKLSGFVVVIRTWDKEDLCLK